MPSETDSEYLTQAKRDFLGLMTSRSPNGLLGDVGRSHSEACFNFHFGLTKMHAEHFLLWHSVEKKTKRNKNSYRI